MFNALSGCEKRKAVCHAFQRNRGYHAICFTSHLSRSASQPVIRLSVFTEVPTRFISSTPPPPAVIGHSFAPSVQSNRREFVSVNSAFSLSIFPGMSIDRMFQVFAFDEEQVHTREC